MYSNPPCHGAFIIDRIVRSPELLAEFMGEMKNVANRITDMRKALYDELVVLKVPGNWTHIINQIGMFSYTGLTRKFIKSLNNLNFSSTMYSFNQQASYLPTQKRKNFNGRY